MAALLLLSTLAAAEPKPADRLRVTSDLMSVYPDKNYSEFIGHVEAIYQGRLLRCRRLKAFFSKEAKSLDRIEAEEDVVLIDKEIEARCARAVYYKDRDLVVLKGDPHLKSGDNIFRGQVINVNLTSRRLTIEGGVEADIAPEKKAD
ncbi:MAG: hypothetical protein A3G34_05255 [Candidatus Lindowbacteria bacterium RIFCSPLOWO2_12_FULL_62_27]|nr:MAG: hypothetical protein A3G34_05255 [Candidatus Lindowbacteria bacterium RIFCSPLOWO2_12_FULL_62_27]